MSTCTHRRKGIVTNQPGAYDDLRRQASVEVCARSRCVDAALAWVAASTGESGVFVPDSRRDPDRAADGSYIRALYGVPATLGREITVAGRVGRITGFDGQFLLFTASGEAEQRIHPLDRVDYLDGGP